MTDIVTRPGTKDDARALAELINFAGEGMPLYLWDKLREGGETDWEVGCCRAARDEGGFSWRNATIAETGGKVAACLIGYPLADTPEQIDYDTMPPMFVPLQELENLAPSTWYVNVLAAYPEHRGGGTGTYLLGIAEQKAREAGCAGLSIIVSDTNTGARRLYERCGYREAATRSMVKEGWDNEGRNWVLLLK